MLFDLVSCGELKLAQGVEGARLPILRAMVSRATVVSRRWRVAR